VVIKDLTGDKLRSEKRLPLQGLFVTAQKAERKGSGNSTHKTPITFSRTSESAFSAAAKPDFLPDLAVLLLERRTGFPSQRQAASINRLDYSGG
jgi:hypothetical protein